MTFLAAVLKEVLDHPVTQLLVVGSQNVVNGRHQITVLVHQQANLTEVVLDAAHIIWLICQFVDGADEGFIE